MKTNSWVSDFVFSLLTPVHYTYRHHKLIERRGFSLIISNNGYVENNNIKTTVIFQFYLMAGCKNRLLAYAGDVQFDMFRKTVKISGTLSRF